MNNLNDDIKEKEQTSEEEQNEVFQQNKESVKSGEVVSVELEMPPIDNSSDSFEKMAQEINDRISQDNKEEGMQTLAFKDASKIDPNLSTIMKVE